MIAEPAVERRRVSPVERDALWAQAAELITTGGGPEVERVRATARALLDARRDGAADALDQLAEKLERADARVHPRLLRALASGYRSGRP